MCDTDTDYYPGKSQTGGLDKNYFKFCLVFEGGCLSPLVNTKSNVPDEVVDVLCMQTMWDWPYVK
jgi:hypothetical protein